VVLDLLKIMVTEENELISLFYGERVETEPAERLAEQVRELFPSSRGRTALRRTAAFTSILFQWNRSFNEQMNQPAEMAL